ncbi:MULTISPECIES: substrate-binding domain-containing protein [Raoultella]|uniref:substrate-binding domain-containing protein n=1 Tax=Raoultella TaxID=160674 RepID=UPI001F511792|nr:MULTISPECIES: substrate-binding domain-containing protein [Raoultella]MCI1034484.1 substrate-binding domain-containing protein [Raoultella terrigena]
MKNQALALTLMAVMTASLPAMADSYLDQATAAIAKATSNGNQWDGPTTGPKIQPKKKIVFIAEDMKNGGVQGVQQGLSEAAKAAGWDLVTLDGAGSVQAQLAALNQAIAQRPDGIIIGAWNPNVAKFPLKKAAQQKIVLMSWHAEPQPGPVPQFNILNNITSDSNDVARLAAQYAVVRSGGKAQVMIFTDSLYQIALSKANVMKSEIEKCSGCKVVNFIDTPLADTANRMPSLTFSLLQKYGDKFQYSLAINDLYFDFMAPSLKTAGKGGANAPFNISAGDGSISAFQRIRNGDSQIATVAEPLKLQGWQLVDEFNRVFSGQPISGYIAPARLVTKDNIGEDGGPQNIYDPNNNYQQHYKTIWGVN